MWDRVQMAQMRGTRLRSSSGVLPTVSRSKRRGPSLTKNFTSVTVWPSMVAVTPPFPSTRARWSMLIFFISSLLSSWAKKSAMRVPLKLAIFRRIISRSKPFSSRRWYSAVRLASSAGPQQPTQGRLWLGQTAAQPAAVSGPRQWMFWLSRQSFSFHLHSTQTGKRNSSGGLPARSRVRVERNCSLPIGQPGR